MKLTALAKQAPARSTFSIPFYRPLDYVSSIETPVLIAAANKDTICPISAVNEAEKILKNGKVPATFIL